MNRPPQIAHSAAWRRAWHGLDAFSALILAISAAKIVGFLGLVVSHWSSLAAGPFPAVVSLTHIGVFGGAAFFLTAAGRRDLRAVHLGVFFVLVAVSFANGLVVRLEGLEGGARGLSLALLAIHPEAFLPLFLWRFVRQFPRLNRFDRGQGVERTFVGTALWTGWMSFLASALFGIGAGSLLPAVSALAWGAPGFWFEKLMFGLAIPALPFGLWKARRADVRESRRYSLFMTGLAAGFLPLAAEVLAELLSPAYEAFITAPRRTFLASLILYPLFLSIPVTTAYAVLVHRVIDVKVLVRTAMQYALARFTLLALAAVPAGLLLVSLARNPDLTVGALFTKSEALSSGAPLAVLFVVLIGRRTLLDRVDRVFFREAVDTRTVLAALAATGEGRDDTLEGVCSSFRERLRAAFHLAQADILLADPEEGCLSSVARRLRPLSLDSTLGSALAARTSPMVVELDAPRGFVRDLPIDDQQWLADADVHLLIPLRSGERFVGVMALGEKLNYLPFSGDDQTQLMTVAAALALNVENLRLRATPLGAWGVRRESPEDRVGEEPALVCGTCFFVSGPASHRCDRCGGPLSPSQLPALLAQKFRLEQELGRGGMGVVYRAFDITLERPVAIKTLPRVSVAESVRLRREARAMAGFSHPHLASIFGLESFRGSPALVMEYLDGGTLADRLRASRIAPLDVANLARDLAGAIALIHDAGLLHRDIKPSNIAFTSTGQPKLLDFGLAQISAASGPREGQTRATFDAQTWTAGSDLTTRDRHEGIAGTPAYVAPEALGGQALDGASDLWSLGVVLFECLTGERLLKGRPLDEAHADWERVLLERAPECPPYLASIVADLLASDKRKRPSARIVRIRLEDGRTLTV